MLKFFIIIYPESVKSIKKRLKRRLRNGEATAGCPQRRVALLNPRRRAKARWRREKMSIPEVNEIGASLRKDWRLMRSI